MEDYSFLLNRFWEPVEDLLLGTANVFLQSLAYSLDFADEICIVDYKVIYIFK
jgi:hypothetical protein